jgi:DNA-binding transcriptional LysR family regulator
MLNSLHVKYFFDTVRLKSVSKAAKHNCVSQSAVSQAISRLEKSLQQPLLHHGKRTLQLTSQGKLFFEKATHFISLQEDLLSCFSEKKEDSTAISISCTHTLALSLLCPALALLQKNHPSLSIHINIDHPEAIKEKVVAGMTDIGISQTIGQKIGFIPLDVVTKADSLLQDASHRLLSTRVGVALPSQQSEERATISTLLLEGPFCFYQSKKENITKELPLLVCEEHADCSHFQKWWDTQEQPQLLVVNSWEMIAKMTEAGLGLGFLPNYIERSQMFNIEHASNKTLSANYKISAFCQKRPSIAAQNVFAIVKNTICA